MRHTYATWSLVAGVDIFALARRMGTSVKMIDRTGLGRAHLESCPVTRSPETRKAPEYQGFYEGRERRDSNPCPPA
jgi:hypothetical protein